MSPPSIAPQILWSRIRRRAFWDREVDFQVWKARVLEAHPAYLPNSASRFTPEQFSWMLGHEAYVLHWPRLRTQLPISRRLWAYHDVWWSKLAAGNFNVKPLEAWFSLLPASRRFLLAVAERPGQTVAEVAQALDLEEQVARDFKCQLVDAGFIQIYETRSKGRPVQLLYPY